MYIGFCTLLSFALHRLSFPYKWFLKHDIEPSHVHRYVYMQRPIGLAHCTCIAFPSLRNFGLVAWILHGGPPPPLICFREGVAL